jgi:excisionase family DNA binding protein
MSKHYHGTIDRETQIGIGHYTSAPPRRSFNIYGAAEYCSCRCSAIEEAIRDGRLRARRLGRGFVITREDLDAFLDLLPAVEPHTPPSILVRRAARAVSNQRCEQMNESAMRTSDIRTATSRTR